MQDKFGRWKIRIERYRRVRLNRRIRKVKKASRHPYAVPAITFSILLFITAIGFLSYVIFAQGNNNDKKLQRYIVIISHDGGQQIVPSDEPTVGALLTKLHLSLNKGDVVEPALDTRINADEFRINVYRALPVEIDDSGTKSFTFSAAKTPRAIAQQSGLSLYPEDEVTTSPASDFASQGAIGQVINIKRSVPVNLVLYGTPFVTRTHSDTVGQMLSEKNIVLKNGDTVQPDINSPIAAGQNVFVLHAGTTATTTVVTIPEPVQYINDPSLSVGTTAIRQQGSPGELLQTYVLDVKTGVKTGIQQVQIQAAVPEVLAVGTAPVTSSLSQWLYALRMCESHGNYSDNTGNGYFGAYQFSLGTWERLGYSGLPSSAPPSVQDEAIVRNTNVSSGGLATQNPGCYYKTGISAFPPSQ
jgi:resuscitation-promoting factor RpfB